MLAYAQYMVFLPVCLTDAFSNHVLQLGKNLWVRLVVGDLVFTLLTNLCSAVASPTYCNAIFQDSSGTLAMASEVSPRQVSKALPSCHQRSLNVICRPIKNLRVLFLNSCLFDHDFSFELTMEYSG